MGVHVVLGLQQILHLFGVGVKLQPLLVGREGHTLGHDAGGFEPGANGIHGLLGRREDVMNFLHGVVLAVAGRLVARPVGTVSAIVHGHAILKGGRPQST